MTAVAILPLPEDNVSQVRESALSKRKKSKGSGSLLKFGSIRRRRTLGLPSDHRMPEVSKGRRFSPEAWSNPVFVLCLGRKNRERRRLGWPC